MEIVVKVFLNAILIVAILEAAKRSLLLAALVASLPLTSIIAMVWVYNESKDISKVTDLSQGIFLMLLPSLVFFISFPLFVKKGFHFYGSLSFSIVAMLLAYFVFKSVLKHVGIN